MGTIMPDPSSFFLAANSIAMALAVCIEYTAESHADEGRVHVGKDLQQDRCLQSHRQLKGLITARILWRTPVNDVICQICAMLY